MTDKQGSTSDHKCEEKASPKSKSSILKHLEKDIDDYLLWMISSGYCQGSFKHHEVTLNHFQSFIKRNKIVWDDIFTLATLENFQNDVGLSFSYPIIGLSRYLFDQKRIKRPIQKTDRRLPDIYEEYLVYYKKSRDVHDRRINLIKRVLAAFHDYLEEKTIKLSLLNIEQVDQFFAEFNTGFAQETCKSYRSMIRGFIKYLYHERKVIKRDLAPLVVGAPVYEFTKPPMFLRPHEIQRLFDNIDLSTPTGLLTHAMLQLAYYLGLRPKEISLITLDDIAFSKGEISITERKFTNPIKLPLPESVIKGIAAYLIGARPESRHRTLFFTLSAPYRPIVPSTVGFHLKNLMLKAGLPSTAYSLRHTYAQNLLEAGTTICEIGEMMGHESIRSTQKYLRIHIKLMREVLFDE